MAGRFYRLLVALIAQLDRASDYGSEGSRFNSWWVHHGIRFWLRFGIHFFPVRFVLIAEPIKADPGERISRPHSLDWKPRVPRFRIRHILIEELRIFTVTPVLILRWIHAFCVELGARQKLLAERGQN